MEVDKYFVITIEHKDTKVSVECGPAEYISSPNILENHLYTGGCKAAVKKFIHAFQKTQKKR